MGTRPCKSKTDVRKLARNRKTCFPKCLRYGYFVSGFTFVITAVFRVVEAEIVVFYDVTLYTVIGVFQHF